jgi:hypothetical protein
MAAFTVPTPQSLDQTRLQNISQNPPVPTDPQLVALAQQQQLIGIAQPAQPLTSATTGLYSLLGGVSQLQQTVAQPIQQVQTVIQTAQRAGRDISGVINNFNTLKNSIFGSPDNAKQNAAIATAPIKGNPTVTYSPTVESADYIKDHNKQINQSQLATKPPAATARSIIAGSSVAWVLTTSERQALCGQDKSHIYDPIQFYVNPSHIIYDFELNESLEFSQKGYFYSNWVATDVANRIPAIKINFTFQSSNILPETYATDTTIHLNGKAINNVSDYKEPPGIDNFYRILDIFNSDQTMDGSIFNDTNLGKKLDGQPNFCILQISTRIFPLLTLYGFFTTGLNLQEEAINPLGFETQLSFIALKSDPNWWEFQKISDRYNNFYKSWISGSQLAGTTSSQIQFSINAALNTANTLKNPVDMKQAALRDTSIPAPVVPSLPAGDTTANLFKSAYAPDPKFELGLATGTLNLPSYSSLSSPNYTPGAVSTSSQSLLADGTSASTDTLKLPTSDGSGIIASSTSVIDPSTGATATYTKYGSLDSQWSGIAYNLGGSTTAIATGSSGTNNGTLLDTTSQNGGSVSTTASGITVPGGNLAAITQANNPVNNLDNANAFLNSPAGQGNATYSSGSTTENGVVTASFSTGSSAVADPEALKAAVAAKVTPNTPAPVTAASTPVAASPATPVAPDVTPATGKGTTGSYGDAQAGADLNKNMNAVFAGIK